jgi:tyrosyl-tRNA synthetase
METYYELLLGEGPPDLPAVEAKRALARRIADRFHGGDAAASAEEQFDRVHRAHLPPEEVEELVVSEALLADGKVHLPALVAEGFGTSRSEARRLLEQGGIRLDGEPLGADALDLEPGKLDGSVLQVGRRKFRRIRLPS